MVQSHFSFAPLWIQPQHFLYRRSKHRYHLDSQNHHRLAAQDPLSHVVPRHLQQQKINYQKTNKICLFIQYLQCQRRLFTYSAFLHRFQLLAEHSCETVTLFLFCLED